jgi:hypothetical protein
VPDPRAESPHAGPPSRGFHVPPATAFLTRPPGTTSTDLGRPDRTDLRDRDEQADRSDASLRRIGARPPPAARRPREGILQRILRRAQNEYGQDAKSLDCRGPVRRSSILVCRHRLPVRRVTGQTRAPVGSADGRSALWLSRVEGWGCFGLLGVGTALSPRRGSADPYSGRRVAGQEGPVCHH